MKERQMPDLEQVRREFETWREQRTSPRERIPERLWAAAIALLEHYAISKVSQELRLEYNQLKQRYTQSVEVSQPATFLQLRVGQSGLVDIAQPEIEAAECQIVYERGNGSRLTIKLPVNAGNITTICASILQV